MGKARKRTRQRAGLRESTSNGPPEKNEEMRRVPCWLFFLWFGERGMAVLRERSKGQGR